MMRALTVVLSFVFVVHVVGQKYVGRTRGGGSAISPKFPVHPKPVAPIAKRPIAPHPMPVFGGGIGGLTGGLASLQGGRVLPLHIQRLIGSTLNGQPFIGGVDGLPRHGGAGIGENFKNGLRGNWGHDGSVAPIQAVSAWQDPLQGHAFPLNYEGGELWFDQSAGRYVARQRHNMAKATGVGAAGQIHHDVAKASSGIGIGHAIDPIGHDIAKSGGMVGGPALIHHDVAKASSGMGIGHAIDPIGHDIAKSGGMVGGPAQIHHDINKASSGMGVGQFGEPLGMGMVGGPTQMHHDINKASSGMDVGQFGEPLGMGMVGGPAQIHHDINKASSGMDVGQFGEPLGMGMVGGPAQVHHDINKASSGMAVGQFGEPLGVGMVGGPAQMHHDINKASSGMDVGQFGEPLGMGMVGGPAQMHHDIGKASSGMAVGPLQGHHGIAKASVGVPAFHPAVNPIGHNIAKASDGVAMVGGGRFVDPIGHDIAKASSGVQVMDPFGPSPIHHGGPSSISAGRPIFNNPVHNVDKAVASGIPSMGADDLSGHMGSSMARAAIRESAQIIDMGTRGGVSFGDPLASAAAHGLAKESVHVAGKTLGLASSGAVHRPAIASSAVKRITGYQGRQRKPPVMKQW